MTKTISLVEIALALFANDGEKKDETTFKPFEKEPVTADYRILGLGDSEVNKSIRGSAIKDKSQNGNPIIRVNFGVKLDGKTVYFNGALNKTKEKKSEKSPDLFGTLKSKGDTPFELNAAFWVKQDKNGKSYYAGNADNKPREEATTEQPVAATAEEDFPV